MPLQQDLIDKLRDHLEWKPTDSMTPRQTTRYLAMALCGEAGELANVVKKEWRGDVITTTGIREWKASLRSEVADVLNYIHMICIAEGINPEEAMWTKLIEAEEKKRIREGG